MIRHLPQHIIEAIAAGEVVDRPASVVKELIENAIDAGASQLKIALEDAGITKIIVTDNGRGMSLADLQLCYLPHTTSKIFEYQDLDKILTMGFRGEALASLVAAAKLTIQSKPADQATGYQLVIDQTPAEPLPIGMPYGTTVIVEDLFRHLPARRKFLKKPATEWRQVLETITQLSLAHPQVGFLVSHNQHLKLDLPAHQSLPERAHQVLGANLTTNATTIEFQTDTMRLFGLLGHPATASTQAAQHLVVNKRPVSHPELAQTITQIYTQLPKRQRPFFLLHLTIDPQAYDIHIHPRKETLRFSDEAALLTTLQTAITDHLNTTELFHYTDPEANEPFTRQGSSLTHDLLKDLTKAWQAKPASTQISQIANTYIALPTDQGLILIDQHAAHERILFEQFLAQYQASQESEPNTHQLSEPVVLELTPATADLLDHNLPDLRQLGFTIEPFGRHTFSLTGIPSLLQDRQPEKLLRSVLEDFDTNYLKTKLDEKSLRTIAYLSCRGAVMAGDPLTQTEMMAIVEKLEATPNNSTCPHGRPTKILLSLAELEKLFGRRGMIT